LCSSARRRGSPDFKGDETDRIGTWRPSDEPHALGLASALGKASALRAGRSAIVGAGANRASIAADLVRAGLDLTFIEQSPAHAKAMRTNGVWFVMPYETLVTPVRAVHRGGSGGLDEGPPRGRRRHTTAFVVQKQRCLGRHALVNEALIAIAIRIESGVLAALPSNADLRRSAFGAWGGLCK
jgi:hypothetical protein